MARRFLPVVTTGCDRRVALRGIALGALGLAGCRMSLEEGAGADAGPDGTPVDPPDPGFEMCGDDLCFDLAKPANEALRQIGGTRTVIVAPRRYIVIRTGEATFAALSAVCTHSGCTVRLATDELLCPCHGSRFELDGRVIAGPADRPLAVFATSFDPGTQILTVSV